MDAPARHLLLHGVIVFIVGLIAGYPYGAAIIHRDSEERIRAWRLAHSSLIVGATMMVAISSVLSHLNAGPIARWLIAISFVVSGYSFAVVLPIAAWAGQRGLTASGPRWNRVVFAGNSLGALASLVSAVTLLYACLMSV